MGKLIQQYRGRVEDSPWDNLFAEFASIVDPVDGAVEIQKDLNGNTRLFLIFFGVQRAYHEISEGYSRQLCPAIFLYKKRKNQPRQ